MKNIFDDINGMKSLSDGWDGDNSYAPSRSVINNTLILLKSLPEEYHNNHTLALPTKHGTIDILWKSSNKDMLSLEVGTNTMSYYCTCNGNTIFKSNAQLIESEFDIFNMHLLNIKE